MGIGRGGELDVDVAKSNETLENRDVLLSEAGLTNTQSELMKLNGILADVVSTPARSLKQSEHDRLGEDVTEALRRVIQLISEQLLVIIEVQSRVKKHPQSQLRVCVLFRKKRFSKKTPEVCLDNSIAEVNTTTSDDKEITALLSDELRDKFCDLWNREGSVGYEHKGEKILGHLVLLQVQPVQAKSKDVVNIATDALGLSKEAITRLLLDQETTSVKGPKEAAL
ncbi:hypothetical protein HG531_009028 [Fusarium graminearum]|nr:hypothetical protein HG531_009028 [Fusarium graminearum]